MMGKPNLQQIPIPGHPGRQVVRRFLGLPNDESDYYDYDDYDDWDELDPWPEDEDDGDDLDDLDAACLPGVPL